MASGAELFRARTSSIRRALIGYLAIIGLLCAMFALAAVTIVDAADRDRAAALIDGDILETVDKLDGPLALRSEKARAVVLVRTALGGERLYRLTDHGRVIAGVGAEMRFAPLRGELLVSKTPPALARRVPLAPGVELLVGRRLGQGELTHRLLVVDTMLLICALLAAAAVGLMFSRRLTERVAAINAACDRVRLGDFAARAELPPADDDEFAALARHVNAMLERIATLVEGLRDVSNRIAHDLRTPVARLKSDIEEAAAAPDLRIARELAGAAAAETDEILQTFEALLDIAEVEAGGSGGLAPMRLDEAVASALELYAPVAEAGGVAIAARLDPVVILGERSLIVRLAANLIDNAIKFSTATDGIELCVTGVDGGGRAHALLTIVDDGPGIPAAERERVLRRFERGTNGASVRGHGLGLALVTAVAKRHGASVRLADAVPGLRVEICFERFAGEVLDKPRHAVPALARAETAGQRRAPRAEARAPRPAGEAIRESPP